MRRRDPQPDPATAAEHDALEAALRGAPDADPELLVVVAGARDVRPVADDAVRARLDQRVAAASEAASRSRRGRRARRRAAAAIPRRTPEGERSVRRRGASRRLLPVAAVALALVVVVPTGLAVLGGGEQDAATTVELGPESGEVPSAAGRAAPTGGADATTVVPGPTVPPAPSTVAPTAPVPPGTPRAVARDVSQVVRVAPRTLPEATAAVPGIVARAGGYVASSAIRERGPAAGAELALVVPEPALERTLARIGELGTPVRLDREAVDLTAEAVSVDDRLGDLRAERTAVRRRLAGAGTEAGAERLRSRLASLSRRVAAAQAERRALRARTDDGRIDLELRAGAVAPAAPDAGWGLRDAWTDAGRVLDVVAGVLLLLGVVVLPPALLAIAGVVGLRAARRVARERALRA